MASSTPQQSKGLSISEGGQSRRLEDDRAPYQEDPSDNEQGKKNIRQRGPPRRHHKKPLRQPRTYSTDNHHAGYAADVQPSFLEASYGPGPRSDNLYRQGTEPYQQDASSWYPQTSPAGPSTYPANYSGSYSYPSDTYSYFPATSPTMIPYSQPGLYSQPPMEFDEDYTTAAMYEPPPPVPPYPKYPTREPRRPPPRPLAPRQPASSPEHTMGGAIREIPERLPKKKPSSRKKDSTSSSNDQRTMLIMGQVLEGLNTLQRQLEDRSSEVRSDPGRFGPPRHPRSVATTSQYTMDDTRSLDVERQERDHLVGIINRLLEDRERQGYRNSHLQSQRRDIAALIEDSLGLNENEMSRAMIRHSDSKEIESKLDTILDLLVERRSNNSQAPQPFLQTYHRQRQDRQVPRGDQTVISISSSREPNMRRHVLQRRATVAQPVSRERQYVQHHTTHSSNQARVRMRANKATGPAEDSDGESVEDYDLFQGYETQDSPLQKDLRARRLSLARDMEDGNARSGVVSEQQRGNNTRGISRRLSEGGEQKMRPRYYATIENVNDDDDDYGEDQVPIPTRSSRAHRPKVEQGEKKILHVPDPPASVIRQRRRGARVRFDSA
ncbi:hypothetical protein FLAG1_11313 [Fusarium langsethiae]|uniref:Uncharacterized protein n=1 Tax=Fusarium langsethiae TaxID=179993 RepID=A0A0M9EMA8_FUSLA|nr:hypothetical protein FLAG1_11313 [Fusarium langsethiae]GKU08106.1 unnamed protein product [Fusarium langsethiae]